VCQTVSYAAVKSRKTAPVFRFCYDDADKYQFGFKKSHSTSLCTDVFKKAVSYYNNRGSYVFTCFIDFTKAFDRVNCWKMFNKLLDDGINSSIVAVLAYW